MTRVVRISRYLLSALFRRPTLSPAHHLRAQISHTPPLLSLSLCSHSFADCWALCVELGLVREPHQSGRAARRRWGREEAVGDGGGPHPSI